MDNLKLINLTLLSHFKSKVDELLDKKVNKTDIATTEQLGLIKPDNNTVFVDENGVLSSMGGSGGVSTTYALSDLTDVELTSLTNGQGLFYDGVLQKWVNGDITNGGSSSGGSNNNQSNLLSDVSIDIPYDNLGEDIEWTCNVGILSDSIQSGNILFYLDGELITTEVIDVQRGTNNITTTFLLNKSGSLRVITTVGYILSVDLSVVENLPYLTSNTTTINDKVYTVSGSSNYSADYDCYKPFMENNNRGMNDAWHPTSGAPQWLMLELPEAKSVSNFTMYNRINYIECPGQVTFQGSNDGETWDDLRAFVFSNNAVTNVSHTETFSQGKAYSKYRWYINTVNASYGVISKITLQFHKENIYKEFVPASNNINVMTQNEFDSTEDKTTLGIVGICNIGCVITSLYDCSKWDENAYIYEVATTSTDGFTASVKITKLSSNLGTEVDAFNYLYSDVKDISSTFDDAFIIIYNSTLLNWELTTLVDVEDVETGIQYSANDTIATWQYNTTYNKQFKVL